VLPTQQKDRPKAVSLYSDRAGDQAMPSGALFGFRRYATKPRPQKPRIIIAQVEGSGMADIVASIVPLELRLLLAVSVKV
jgi:hypothetical protein